MNYKLKRHYSKGWSHSSDRSTTGTTRDLTKVLIILGEIKYCNATYLSKLGMGARINDSLLWLANHNLISKIKTGRAVVYCLEKNKEDIEQLLIINNRLRTR